MTTSWKRPALGVFALLSLVGLGGCDTFGPEQPEGPGAIFVDLRSPNGNEGAGVFRIEDLSGLGEVTSIGAWVFTEPEGEGMRVVVILPTPGPVQFQVSADDVSRLPKVSLIQVAGPENQLREELEGYEVELFQMVEREIR
jgi:hypothetical protein